MSDKGPKYKLRPKDLRNKTTEELNELKANYSSELMNMDKDRNSVGGFVGKESGIYRELKLNIARIKTILKERKQ